MILRELVLKVHPKLADHLVNQAMTSTPNVDAENGTARKSSTIGRAAAAATIEPDIQPARRRAHRLRPMPAPGTNRISLDVARSAIPKSFDSCRATGM